MKGLTKKVKARMRRKMRIRKRLTGTPERPRLVVFRSARHIYAQVVDDTKGVTLSAASSLSPEIRDRVKECKGKAEVAKLVGQLVGKRAAEKGIRTVAFDRGGYKYHGRVKALADGARESGLEF